MKDNWKYRANRVLWLAHATHVFKVNQFGSVYKPKMTYPLGFCFSGYCGECLAGSSCGVWCAVLLPCMLNCQQCAVGFGKRARTFFRAAEEDIGLSDEELDKSREQA
jgi:hypothetical protein